MPDDWADGDRRRGGVSRAQAFMRNCRNQASDAKEKLKRSKPRGESTDTEDWDGPSRRSVEDPVMGSEQRGRIRQSYCLKQLETG